MIIYFPPGRECRIVISLPGSPPIVVPGKIPDMVSMMKCGFGRGASMSELKKEIMFR
jgi:hypothetical protein